MTQHLARNLCDVVGENGIDQHNSASVTVQQTQPQLAFEAADLAADGELSETNDPGSTAETSGFGDVNEGFDLPQVDGARSL